ncbi:hypothetical protein GEOBC_01238 [Geobacteraceae bacterium]|nr:hypothetical protein GEOBC_01238 [Geobacteraceae bacterium]
MKRYLPACILLLSFSAHGALHKWVDADGKVHYSDEAPPANIKAQRLKTQSAPAAATSASGVPATKTVAEREAEYRKAQKAKQEAEQKSAKQQEETLARRKNCEAAQQNLKALEAGAPMVTYDAKGERSFLDDTTRQQRIDEARKIISTDCN